jgi:chorismate mutase
MTKLKNISTINNWFQNFSEPLIIAGPCSAESEDQVMQTAKQIADLGKVSIYRAGVWKPRTRPGNFEGVGEEALQWLKQVKAETGLLTAVEVANADHLEKAIKADIDILWIGARTTSNPFSVQELADRLKGYDKPIMVKNPINPDVQLWVGALERFYKAGVTKLAAIHRGFYPFEATTLRNIPKWEIPIELKSICHDLPIICDPSHIAGNTEYIPEIAQKAMDLNMAGLMIETHYDPTVALSDMFQQLTPKMLGELLNGIVYRRSSSNNDGFESVLETLREQIDSIDKQMLELLSQRMNVVEDIGKYKSKNEVTILQLRRWEKIISTRVKLGKKLGLTEDFVKKLLQLVHKESIQRQTEVMNKISSKKK